MTPRSSEMTSTGELYRLAVLTVLTGLCVCVTDSREQAFVQSLSTAVLVQAVSKACSAGLSSHCSCGPVPNDAPSDHQMENFQWGGCPDDLPYGLAFSRVFERTRPSSSKRRKVSRRALINQHNSDVGRQVLTPIIISTLPSATKCSMSRI